MIKRFDNFGEKSDILVVLDIDETLINSKHKWVDDNYDIDLFDGVMYTYKRPHVDEFLKYVFENFRVAVWTAAGHTYAEEVLKMLNFDMSKLEFFKWEAHCDIKYNHRMRRAYYIKDLQEIANEYPLEKAILIDDNPGGIALKSNWLFIPPFSYPNPNDTYLLDTIEFLEKLKNTKDVDIRNYDKEVFP